MGFLSGAAVLWLATPTALSLTVGGLIAIAGELLRIWAAGHLEKGREVTRTGPYRLTRHPLYLGSAIVGLGAAIAASRLVVSLIIVAYLSATIAAAIRIEEANMRASFGDQYDAYVESRARRVSRGFSISRAIKNKEHRAVAGLAAVAVILAVKVVLR